MGGNSTVRPRVVAIHFFLKTKFPLLEQAGQRNPETKNDDHGGKNRPVLRRKVRSDLGAQPSVNEDLRLGKTWDSLLNSLLKLLRKKRLSRLSPLFLAPVIVEYHQCATKGEQLADPRLCSNDRFRLDPVAYLRRARQ